MYYGGIVSRVDNHGVKECHVIEPNVLDSSFVKERNPNVIVHNSLFDDVNLSNDYFDVIVAFDVVEHVFNPKDFLKSRLIIEKRWYISHRCTKSR